MRAHPACDERSPQDPKRFCDFNFGHRGQCWSMDSLDRPVLWWWSRLSLPPENATREQLEAWLDR